MPSPTDSIDLSPSLALNEIRNSPLDDSGETSLGQKKNQLTNCALEEQVERDRQRKLHRRVVFWLLAPVCLTFYGVFLYAVWSLYSDLTRLANIPVAWVLPVVSLVTVPTICYPPRRRLRSCWNSISRTTICYPPRRRLRRLLGKEIFRIFCYPPRRRLRRHGLRTAF